MPLPHRAYPQPVIPAQAGIHGGKQIKQNHRNQHSCALQPENGSQPAWELVAGVLVWLGLGFALRLAPLRFTAPQPVIPAQAGIHGGKQTKQNHSNQHNQHSCALRGINSLQGA